MELEELLRTMHNLRKYAEVGERNQKKLIELREKWKNNPEKLVGILRNYVTIETKNLGEFDKAVETVLSLDLSETVSEMLLKLKDGIKSQKELVGNLEKIVKEGENLKNIWELFNRLKKGGNYGE